MNFGGVRVSESIVPGSESKCSESSICLSQSSVSPAFSIVDCRWTDHVEESPSFPYSSSLRLPTDRMNHHARTESSGVITDTNNCFIHACLAFLSTRT